MLILGPKAKFCGRGLATGWLWPYRFSLGQKLRLKSLQNSALTAVESSLVNYISRSNVPYLLTCVTDE